MNDRPTLRVGYVLKRFPRFSETFILNELLELGRQGIDVEVFSLLRPPEEGHHAFLSKLQAQVTYLPPGRAIGKWTVSTGMSEATREDIGIKELFADGTLPFQELFPGKDPTRVSQLCLQATTLAMLATARGINHFHAHFGSDATTVALLAARLTGIPFSYTAHARDIYHTYVDPDNDNDLRRRKITEARFVVTVSDYNRNHLRTIANIADNVRIRRLYNGIDLSRFRPDPAKQESDLFVAVGRLVEKKGFPDLIEACHILRKRGRRFRCFIIGEGPDRAALTYQVQALNLTQHVTLEGAQPQEQLIETMKPAAAVVLPCVVGTSGDRDGLPTVLLEGMALGLPAISTRVAGIPEIIDHERTGFLVPPENPMELACAMERLLVDPALGARLGRAGRLKAEREFDLKKNVATLVDYFTDSNAVELPFRDIHDASRIRLSG